MSYGIHPAAKEEYLNSIRWMIQHYYLTLRTFRSRGSKKTHFDQQGFPFLHNITY